MLEREREAWALVRNLLVQLAELVSRLTLEINSQYSGPLGVSAQAEVQKRLSEHLRRLSVELDRARSNTERFQWWWRPTPDKWRDAYYSFSSRVLADCNLSWTSLERTIRATDAEITGVLGKLSRGEYAPTNI